jgi:hypothetical protein
MIDSTIIIGLLVLLTLNTLSSPFVQGEQATFFDKWYEAKQDLRQIDKVLLECNTLLLDRDKSYDEFVAIAKSDGIDTTDEDYATRGPDDEMRIYEWFEDYEENMKIRCGELPSERLELTKKLEVLDKWGIEFYYLDIDPETSQIVESKYHKDLSSGPFLTIMTNIGMIFPFLISVIADTIIKSRKKNDDENASKLGIGLMFVGFLVMIAGMGVIGYSYYEAAAPFLDF